MKKALLFLSLCCCAISVPAQELFYGTIEYNMILEGPRKNTTDPPKKWTIIHGRDKILVDATFEGGPNQWKIFHLLTDTVYTVIPKAGVFYKWPVKIEIGTWLNPNIKPTDSIKEILGYRCRGYRPVMNAGLNTDLVWLADSLVSAAAGNNRNDTANYMIPAHVGGHIILGFTWFDNGQPGKSLTASAIHKMNSVPDSVFDFARFKEVPDPMVSLSRSFSSQSDYGSQLFLKNLKFVPKKRKRKSHKQIKSTVSKQKN